MLLGVWTRTTLPYGRAQIAKLGRTSTLHMVAPDLEVHHSFAVGALLPPLVGRKLLESEVRRCVLAKPRRMGGLPASRARSDEASETVQRPMNHRSRQCGKRRNNGRRARGAPCLFRPQKIGTLAAINAITDGRAILDALALVSRSQTRVLEQFDEILGWQPAAATFRGIRGFVPHANFDVARDAAAADVMAAGRAEGRRGWALFFAKGAFHAAFRI